MPKAARTPFACQACGAKSHRWSGRCVACGAWNTLVEEIDEPAPGGGRDAPRLFSPEGPRPLAAIDGRDAPRDPTGVAELDRLLGGGLVTGSATLIGGEPGIGKSTLLLQLCAEAARRRRKALYVTGEESPAQVKLRAARLGLAGSPLLLAAETDCERILAALQKEKPALAVVDSIQTVVHATLGAAPGSVGQVRESAARIVTAAKMLGTAVVLVGHVTKDGAIAGPKTLEHMVDTVLYFEGERFQHLRILRATKNRFGATHEIAVFEMTGRGLSAVADPSALFLSGNAAARPGAVVCPVIEGSRAFLVEIQALAAPARYGTPERRATGLDPNRLRMILAVLERRAGLALGAQDVFVNVVGGLEVREPAADLAVALAAASSLLERALPAKAVAFGELGLSGEIRPVGQAEQRLAEAARLGFVEAIAPTGAPPRKGIGVSGAAWLSEAVERLQAAPRPGASR